MKTQEEIRQMPTILDVLESIAKEEEIIKKDPVAGFFFSQDDMDDKFEITQTYEDGPLELVPTYHFLRPYYRGQSQYYEPSYPSLYRNLENSDDISLFIEYVRVCELELLVHSHPFAQLGFQELLRLDLEKIGYTEIELTIDSMALAQHYELQTNLMDVTLDKWAAAFFATTKWKKGEPTPIDSNSYGVFYHYDPRRNFLLEPFVENPHSPITFQPFPRPAAQRAGTVKLDKGVDFNTLPGVSKTFFRHDKLASEIIYNRMNKGKTLFPDDDLEPIAKDIRVATKFTRDAFNLAFERKPIDDLTKEETEQRCNDRGFKFVNHHPFKFPKDLNKKFKKQWNKKGIDDFLSKIVYRPVYRGPITEVEGADLISNP